MGDIHAGGEVVDVEGVAHVVHGENGEELALHVGDGDGLHGELLLALDGDFVRGGIGPQPHFRLGTVIFGNAYVWRCKLGVMVEGENGTGTACWAAKGDPIAK